MTAPALLAGFLQRGFMLRAAVDRLFVSPASALTADDRKTIFEHRNEMLALLSPCEAWNHEGAIELIHDVDCVVGACGISARDPLLSDAIAMVIDAYETRDMETLRFAVTELRLFIQQIANDESRKRTGIPRLPPKSATSSAQVSGSLRPVETHGEQ